MDPQTIFICLMFATIAAVLLFTLLAPRVFAVDEGFEPEDPLPSK